MSSEELSEEFEGKKSTKSVGQLYPVLLSKDGDVIDGHHRLEDDPSWRTETLDQIDTEEKLLLARAVSNWQRRTITKEEKTEWINGLARIYQKEGFKVYGKKVSVHPKNEIAAKIMDELGLSRTTVGRFLHPKYKQAEPEGIGNRGPKSKASEAIDRLGSSLQYSGDLVERHREELLQDEGFQDQVLKHMKAKEQLDADQEPSDDDLLSDHLKTYPQCICKTCPHCADCMGMK